MGADVAFTERTKDCVGQGMKCDISVTVPFKSMTVLDFYAADPEGLSRNETVDIVTHTHRGSSFRSGPEQSFEDCLVLAICQLVEPRIASNRDDGYPEPPNELRIVRCGLSCSRRVGAAQRAKAKRLRGLNARQGAAVDHIARFFPCLVNERVGDGKSRYRGLSGLECAEQPVNDGCLDSGPGRIVDEHERVILPIGNRQEAILHRLLAFSPGRRKNPAFRKLRRERHDVIACNKDAPRYSRMRRKRVKAPPEERLASEGLKLLGVRKSGTGAATAREQNRGDTQGRNRHGIGHKPRGLAQHRLAGKRLNV